MTPRPTTATLNKYGMSEGLWRLMFLQQGGVCAICRKPSRRMCVDHEHAKGWAKMPPEKRVRYVRGLLCWQCNRFRVGRNTLENARTVLEYLQDYEERRQR